MALIGKIRNNSWLLVVLIGLGLGGFIIMDMTAGQQSVFGSGQTLMADIEGKKVDIQEFNRTFDLAYSGVSGEQMNPTREALYNYLVEEAILQDEAEEIGLGVSKPEVREMIFGSDVNKVSPVIQSRYRNPQTGQFDPSQLSQIKGIIDGGEVDNMIEQGQLVRDFKMRWKHQEREVKKDRLQSKLTNLVAKGMYTPNWMAEMVGNEQNSKVTFAYAQVPYDAVEDSAVNISDEDYSTFLAENKDEYTQKLETRLVDYVIFPVEATEKDKKAIADQIAGLNDNFAKTDDDSTFVQNQSGTISMTWLNKDAVSPVIADTVFQMPVGSIYGPYVDGTNYKSVKVLDRQMLADSADSRHILIRAQTPAQFAEANRKIDSLKNVIETGQNRFDSLAVAFSEDPGSKADGGEYDFIAINQFVPEYNDIMFYKGEVGKLYKVRTSYGIHLVEPQGRKGDRKPYVRLAYITRPIIPSDETQSAALEQAENFVANNQDRAAFLAAAAELDLDVQTSPALKENDYAIGTLGSQPASREIVRWAFNKDIETPNAEIGDVSPEVYSFQNRVNYYTDRIVAVALKSVRPAGELPLAEAKDDTNVELNITKWKKAQMLKEQLSGVSDFSAVVGKYSSAKIDTASNVNLAASRIPNVGKEVDVVAKAFGTSLNTVSSPVKGESGVFVVKPISRPEPTTANVINTKKTNQNQYRSRVRSGLMQALRENADVEDNRSKFF